MASERQYKEVLWAPWRLQYILSDKDRDAECLFCALPGEETDCENLILARGETVFAMLNRFPYNNGHLMVVPYRHLATLSGLTARESAELMSMTQACERALAACMSPEGFNVGFNLGAAAGAGIEEHLHLHVVPRWQGDTNFMPVLGGVDVIPQSLAETYQLLREPLARELRCRANQASASQGA